MTDPFKEEHFRDYLMDHFKLYLQDMEQMVLVNRQITGQEREEILAYIYMGYEGVENLQASTHPVHRTPAEWTPRSLPNKKSQD